MSKIVQVSEKAKVVAPKFEKETGEPFIYFQRGEVGYPTAPFLADAFKEAIEKGHTKYPKPGGEDYFKDAVLADLYEENGISLERKNVAAVYGGQQGLELAFGTFRGGTCAGFTPCWSCMFDNIIPYTEMKFVSVPLSPNDGWSIPWARLEKTLSGSDVFYFNSPHNPTGKVFSVDEVKRIAFLCEKYGVTLICDEAYKGLVYRSHHGHYSPLQTGYQNIVSVNTFSKVFAATGFRIGYMISPREDLIDFFTGGNYTETAGVSTPTQYAFAKALTSPSRKSWEQTYWDEMSKRRAALVNSLGSSLRANMPEGAFYTFFKAAEPNKEAALVDKLMDNGVAVVPGSAFGDDFAGYIRLSFSTLSEELIRKGGERLTRIVISEQNPICEQFHC
jgi:aspartate aminotransferase